MVVSSVSVGEGEEPAGCLKNGACVFKIPFIAALWHVDQTDFPERCRLYQFRCLSLAVNLCHGCWKLGRFTGLRKVFTWDKHC